MSIETAVKFIIVLLLILIVTLTSIFLLVNRDDKEPADTTPVTTVTPPSSSDKGSSTTTQTPTTTAPITTTPEGSGTDVTLPEGTTPAVTDPENTVPPETTPGTPAPEDYTFYGSYLSESGTALNLRAEVIAYAVESGQVKVKVELYLDHFSLYLGTRNGCRLTVGEVTETFASEAISHDGGRTSTLVNSMEIFCSYGDTVALEAYFPCRCTYGAVEIEALSIEEQITLA